MFKLSRPKQITILALLSLAVYVTLSGMLFTSKANDRLRVRHSLSQKQLEALRGRVSERTRQEYEPQFANLKAEFESKVDDLSVQIDALEARSDLSDAEKKLLKDLKAEIDQATADYQTKVEAMSQEVVSAIDQAVLDKQNALLDHGASLLLHEFCSETGYEMDLPSPLNKELIIGSDMCIGVAEAGQAAATAAEFAYFDLETEHRIALDTYHLLQASDMLESDQKFASSAFAADNINRLTQEVRFAVHPVYGAMYAVTVPLQSGDSKADVSYRSFCFRRPWKVGGAVQVEPLTQESKKAHILDPSSLLPTPQQAISASQSRRRQLAGITDVVKARIAATQNTVFMLPVRQSTVRLLPNVLRSVRSAFVSEEQAALRAPIRVVLTPMVEDKDDGTHNHSCTCTLCT